MADNLLDLKDYITTITVTQAYRYAIDPTPRQQRSSGIALQAPPGLLSIGAFSSSRHGSISVERSYLGPGPMDSSLTCGESGTALSTQVAPWWAENCKDAYTVRPGRARQSAQELERVARVAAARAAMSASQGLRRRAGPGTPAGSPPERSRCCPTASTSSSHRSVCSRLMSQLASSPAAWSWAPPASSPPPSAVRPTAGMSPSPSRSNGHLPAGNGRINRRRRGRRHSPPGRAFHRRA